jgi:hypothetical protein
MTLIPLVSLSWQSDTPKLACSCTMNHLKQGLPSSCFAAELSLSRAKMPWHRKEDATLQEEMKSPTEGDVPPRKKASLQF